MSFLEVQYRLYNVLQHGHCASPTDFIHPRLPSSNWVSHMRTRGRTQEKSRQCAPPAHTSEACARTPLISLHAAVARRVVGTRHPHAVLPILPSPSSDAHAARPQAPLPRAATALGRVPLRVDPQSCGAIGNRNERVRRKLGETTSMQSHAGAPAVPTRQAAPSRADSRRSLLATRAPRPAVASRSAVR